MVAFRNFAREPTIAGSHSIAAELSGAPEYQYEQFAKLDEQNFYNLARTQNLITITRFTFQN
jgi:hypothetical protein